MTAEVARALLGGLVLALLDWALIHTPAGWMRAWRRPRPMARSLGGGR